MTGLSPAATVTPLRWDRGDRACPADHDRMGALGDEIINSLFRAGLDVCSALGLAKDESVRVRLERAVDELDDAIKDLRHLMLAVLETPEGSGVSGT